MDPLTSVVGGMAIVAHEGAGHAHKYAYRYENPLAYIRSTSGRAYEHTILRTRMQCYTDRDYTVTRLPLKLSGLHALRTADLDYPDEREALLRFRLTNPSRVYVIYPALAKAVPHWLRAYQREPEMFIEIDTPGGRMPFFAYGRDHAAGLVTLGGPRAEGYRGTVFMNYLVAARPK